MRVLYLLRCSSCTLCANMHAISFRFQAEITSRATFVRRRRTSFGIRLNARSATRARPLNLTPLAFSRICSFSPLVRAYRQNERLNGFSFFFFSMNLETHPTCCDEIHLTRITRDQIFPSNGGCVRSRSASGGRRAARTVPRERARNRACLRDT